VSSDEFKLTGIPLTETSILSALNLVRGGP
jgi:hypothetical protein